MSIWRDIAKTTSPMVRKLHDYWQSKRAGRALPDRADIDPAELKPLLPYLIVAEVVEPPFRIRYRLIGTKIAAVSGLDFTGRFLDELLAADLENRWQEYYLEARNTRAPVLGEVVVPTLHGDLFRYEFGIFPLTKGSDAVAQFIAIEDYGGREPRLREIEDRVAPWRERETPR
jgi:hypothetical protein